MAYCSPAPNTTIRCRACSRMQSIGLSRPSPQIRNVFRDKPVAVIGASPGGFGTISAQAAWLPVWRTLGARHWAGGRLLVSRAHEVFAETGELTDPDLRERLQTFVSGFAAFCEG